MQLKQLYNCAPVFIDQDVKDKYYKGAAATVAAAAAAALQYAWADSMG
jgi:hypothetical protein